MASFTALTVCKNVWEAQTPTYFPPLDPANISAALGKEAASASIFAFFALFRADLTSTRTIDTKMPRIAITINNSIKVKPLLNFFLSMPLYQLYFICKLKQVDKLYYMLLSEPYIGAITEMASTATAMPRRRIKTGSIKTDIESSVLFISFW